LPQVNAVKNVLENVGAYCNTPPPNNTPLQNIPILGIAKGKTRKKK